MKTLSIDVGGANIKCCVRGRKPISFPSGAKLTARELVKRVQTQTADWRFDLIALGLPTVIREGKVVTEPSNLGRGWVNFNFTRAFNKPVRLINDASMQALGAYDGGRMLFLGLGTGLGAALISGSVIVPLELCELMLAQGRAEDRLGQKGFEQLGKAAWRKETIACAQMLKMAFAAEYVVLGGAKPGAGLLDPLPKGLRRGKNEDAFTGGFRLWEHPIEITNKSSAWRLLS